MKEQHLKSLLAEQPAPKNLYHAVVVRIAALERRAARIRAACFGVLSLASFLAFVPVLQYAAQQLYASGFYEYSRLLFTDGSLVASYWREFSLTLLESLPSFALLLLIGVGVVLIWSIKRTAQTARTAFTLKLIY